MKVAAFDAETALIQPGLLAPPIICFSIAEPGSPARVLTKADGLAWLRGALADPQMIVVGANVAFDLAVSAAEDPSLLPLIFQALDEGRIGDTHIRQALDAIGNGHLNLDPRTGGALVDPETGRRKNRYSLAICCDLTLGRKIEKKDTWRMSYARLEGIPLSQWPEDAIAYSRDDAQNTLDLYLAQSKFQNLECEPDEVRAAWALHLMAVRGIRTEADRVAQVAERVDRIHLETQTTFQAAGLIRADGSKDTKAIADRLTKAYNGNPPLTDTGRVKADRLTLTDSGDPLLEELAEAGENEKLHSTYLKVLRQGTKVPINPSFNVLVESGRTSCSNPNLQNLPR